MAKWTVPDLPDLDGVNSESELITGVIEAAILPNITQDGSGILSSARLDELNRLLYRTASTEEQIHGILEIMIEDEEERINR